MVTQKDKDALSNIGCSVLIILTILVIGWGQSALDDAGYISHTRETVITAGSSWLVGESKTCYSVPIEPEYAPRGKAWDVTQRVGCGDGPEHHIKVVFHGRTKRPEQRARFGVAWKCVRRSDSFECYSVD